MHGRVSHQTNRALLVPEHRDIARTHVWYSLAWVTLCPKRANHIDPRGHLPPASWIMPFFIMHRFACISIWAACNDEYSCKRSRTAVQECQHFVERGSPEVSIKDRRPDDSRQREKYKLSWDDDFGVKTFQCSVQISDLEDTCNDKHLHGAISAESTHEGTVLTARIGYVIHSAIIFAHSFVKSVEIALVASTVNPPAQRISPRPDPRIHGTLPKRAHMPTSITTTRLPMLPSLRPVRMTASTKYTIENITKERFVIASIRASGVNTGGGPSDDGDENTTVVAPMMASRIPNMSR